MSSEVSEMDLSIGGHHSTASENENRSDPETSDIISQGEVSESTKLYDRFDWTISDVTAKLTMGEVCSPEFWSYNTLWRMTLIKKSTLSGCHVNLRLWCHLRSSETRFHTRIGMKRSNGRDIWRISCETDKDGFLEVYKLLIWSNRALETGKLKYVSNARIVIFCELCPAETPRQTITSASKYTRLLVENMGDLLDSGSNSDVELKVGSKVFKAHKNIVCARCPVFSSMFQHDMSEANSGVVEIPDCTADAFAFFLRYLYTGKTNAIYSADSDILCNLYYIADKYNVPELKGICSETLMYNLTVDNFCDVVALALLHSESALLRNACKFFTRNVKAIITTARWQTYLSENPIHANELYIKAIDIHSS